MPSSYPGALDTFPTNRADATATATNHKNDHNDAFDAINKIEAELGIDPAGSEATVAARLAALEAAGVSFDLGTLSLLTRPTMVGAKDDHFNAGTLDAKWITDYDGGGGAVDLATMPGWVSVTDGVAILQAVPVGNWMVEAEVIGPASNSVGFTSAGLIVTDGTAAGSADDVRFGPGMDNAATAHRVVLERYINGAFNTTYVNMGSRDHSVHHTWLRLRWDGTLDAWISPTGFGWQAFEVNRNPGFTPTHFGIYGVGFCNYFLVT